MPLPAREAVHTPGREVHWVTAPVVVEAHHVAAAGIVQIRVVPCAEPGIAGGFRGAGDDGEHVGIGDVQDLPHLPADRS